MTVHLKITGKVQGVFYRKSAKIEADLLGIGGWIKNLKDGSVEASAGADKPKLEEFVAWCKKGPPFAKVENVEVEWKDTDSGYSEFEIRN